MAPQNGPWSRQKILKKKKKKKKDFLLNLEILEFILNHNTEKCLAINYINILLRNVENGTHFLCSPPPPPPPRNDYIRMLFRFPGPVGIFTNCTEWLRWLLPTASEG